MAVLGHDLRMLDPVLQGRLLEEPAQYPLLLHFNRKSLLIAKVKGQFPAWHTRLRRPYDAYGLCTGYRVASAPAANGSVLRLGWGCKARVLKGRGSTSSQKQMVNVLGYSRIFSVVFPSLHFIF